jgi:hypothetical protein
VLLRADGMTADEPDEHADIAAATHSNPAR